MREDAAQRVYDKEIAVLLNEGVNIDVDVVTEAGTGMIAKVTIDQQGIENKNLLEKKVMSIFGKFTVKYQLDWK